MKKTKFDLSDSLAEHNSTDNSSDSTPLIPAEPNSADDNSSDSTRTAGSSTVTASPPSDDGRSNVAWNNTSVHNNNAWSSNNIDTSNNRRSNSDAWNNSSNSDAWNISCDHNNDAWKNGSQRNDRWNNNGQNNFPWNNSRSNSDSWSNSNSYAWNNSNNTRGCSNVAWANNSSNNDVWYNSRNNTSGQHHDVWNNSSRSNDNGQNNDALNNSGLNKDIWNNSRQSRATWNNSGYNCEAWNNVNLAQNTDPWNNTSQSSYLWNNSSDKNPWNNSRDHKYAWNINDSWNNRRGRSDAWNNSNAWNNSDAWTHGSNSDVLERALFQSGLNLTDESSEKSSWICIERKTLCELRALQIKDEKAYIDCLVGEVYSHLLHKIYQTRLSDQSSGRELRSNPEGSPIDLSVNEFLSNFVSANDSACQTYYSYKKKKSRFSSVHEPSVKANPHINYIIHEAYMNLFRKFKPGCKGSCQTKYSETPLNLALKKELWGRKIVPVRNSRLSNKPYTHISKNIKLTEKSNNTKNISNSETHGPNDVFDNVIGRHGTRLINIFGTYGIPGQCPLDLRTKKDTVIIDVVND